MLSMEFKYFSVMLVTASFRVLWPPFNLVSANSTSCEPFPFGTNIFNVIVAAFYGSLFPDSCLCTNPCTSIDKYVQFYYNKKGVEHYNQLVLNDLNIGDIIDLNEPVAFIVHGYTDRVQFNGTGWMEPTGIALSNAINGTTILVSYGNVSSCSYDLMVNEIVSAVGYYLANVIKQLRLDLNNVELLGHSLGAHVCGYAGAALNGKIKRITGLDPAGPNFADKGLNKTCAQFVQVMHTDGENLGTNTPMGHADFYPNNKSELQTGCLVKACGHRKAVEYNYAALFPQYEFIGVDCKYALDQDNDTMLDTSRFGVFNDGKIGNFCFNTTACFPFVEDQPLLSSML